MLNQQIIEIKKHVGIIHCANNLSLVQRKIGNALLYNAYNDLLIKEVHAITIRELAKLIGYDSHDIEVLKRAIKALISTVLEWNLLEANNYVDQNLDKENKGESGISKKSSWHASAILASARIDSGICFYSYSPELKKLLYRPEIYGKINLLIQSKFTSSYALALYENCVRYKNLTHTSWINFSIFRKLMGVSENKYYKFKDFKKRVLDKAIQEVNEFSDIFVTIELRRIKQQIEAVRFIIGKNGAFNKTLLIQNTQRKNVGKKENDQQNLEPCDELIQNTLKEKLNLSSTQINSLLEKYDSEYILEKLKLVQDSDSYRKQKINNIAAYFLTALNEDFKPAKTGYSPVKSTMEDYAKEKMTQKKEEEKNNETVQAYNNHVFRVIEDAKLNLKEEEISKIEKGFKEKIHSLNFKSIVEAYNQDGYIHNRRVQALYIDFILKNHPKMIAKVISFEEFAKQYKPSNEQESI
ncbi:MAG: hypothetical protein A2X78_01440 [Gammaproteobacteria bacterium GWE2_37_16]|nr:MAG: hypothetical protein A2X78_01440 [Gammaproteobacteria bacterium GWE2_37_16]